MSRDIESTDLKILLVHRLIHIASKEGGGKLFGSINLHSFFELDAEFSTFLKKGRRPLD